MAGRDNQSCLRHNVLLCEVVEDLVSFGIWNVIQLGSDGNVVGKQEHLKPSPLIRVHSVGAMGG